VIVSVCAHTSPGYLPTRRYTIRIHRLAIVPAVVLHLLVVIFL
jgi:hypothetical protein